MSFQYLMKFPSIVIITVVTHCGFSGVKGTELDKFYKAIDAEALVASDTMVLLLQHERGLAWCREVVTQNKLDIFIYPTDYDGLHKIFNATRNPNEIRLVRCMPYDVGNSGRLDHLRYYVYPHRYSISVFDPVNPHDMNEINWGTETIKISSFKVIRKLVGFLE